MGRKIFLAVCFLLMAQFIRGQNNYYKYTLENFRESNAFQERIDPEHPDKERLNALVFYLTNEIRREHNRSLLKYHPLLEAAAALHSESMVEYGYFDHVNHKDRKLRNPNDRGKVVGIENPYLAENIMESFVLEYTAGVPVYTGESGIFRLQPDDDPLGPHTYLSLGEALLKGWMNSPNHKENILSTQALEFGCGTAFYTNKDFNDMPTVMATQNFQYYEPVKVTK